MIGAKELGKLFVQFNDIHILNISDNPIGVQGFKSIIYSIRKNFTVRELKMNGCDIRLTNEKEEIMEYLEQNCALCKISLERNPHFEREFQLVIDEELKKNEEIRRFVLPIFKHRHQF